MKSSIIGVVAVVAIAVLACTNFQEEDVPVSFSVNREELSFSQNGESQSLNVSSGTKWDVTSIPQWISLQSIKRSGVMPYEWTANFSASANEEYNREGLIIIKSGSDAAEIVVTQEGKKGKFIAVESVSLSPAELTLTEGDNTALTFDIKPSNASIKEVTWKSSDQSVATVTQAGRVDAIAEGTARITITTEDGNKTASCLVSVKAKVISVTGVSLDKTSLSLTEGDVYELNATVTPADASNKSVTWSSSNTSVATVSSSGLVTAKSAGSATITVTTNDGGKKATCAVMVQAQKISVTGVSLNKTSLTMTEGDTQTLAATVTPSNATDKSVTWSSSNTSVATVSSTGVVTAKASGSATITVTTNDGGKKATCAVTVQKVIKVSLVSIKEGPKTLIIGEVFQYTVTILPENATDKTINWSSSDPSVATITSTGLVTAKAVGSTLITAQASSGAGSSCYVTVREKVVSVSSVSLDKSSLSMYEGETQTLYATVLPFDAYDKSVTWSSSNATVATVEPYGLVRAKKAGNATITVTTNDGGKTASCFVSVSAVVLEAIDLGLSVKWGSFNLGASKPEEYGDYFAWGETEPYYSSLDPLTWKEGKEGGYNNQSYKWSHGGSEFAMTKYCTDSRYGYNGYTDGKSELDLEDDVANARLGDLWRMPTESELTELYNSCTWTIADRNDEWGYHVEGPNGNSIFLPAAGVIYSTNYRDVGTFGSYWSSSLDSEYSNTARCIQFYISGSKFNTSNGRSGGLSIRPVYGAPKISVTGVSPSKTSLSMTAGDTQTLTVTVSPSNATDKSVTWSSSNTSVASVSSSGVVTAKAAGTATITVTTTDGGKKATCAVKVQNVALPVLTSVTVSNIQQTSATLSSVKWGLLRFPA